MPKHFIHRTHPDGTPSANRMEIRWQRDSGVQIGTTTWAGDGAPDPQQELLTSPGQAIKVGGEPAETTTLKPAWPGGFVHLDRAQINHAIKWLRIARDQAFGRDE